jgi:hypothetical protein
LESHYNLHCFSVTRGILSWPKKQITEYTVNGGGKVTSWDLSSVDGRTKVKVPLFNLLLKKLQPKFLRAQVCLFSVGSWILMLILSSFQDDMVIELSDVDVQDVKERDLQFLRGHRQVEVRVTAATAVKFIAYVDATVLTELPNLIEKLGTRQSRSIHYVCSGSEISSISRFHPGRCGFAQKRCARLLLQASQTVLPLRSLYP